MRAPMLVAVLVATGCSDSKSPSPSAQPQPAQPQPAQQPQESDVLPPRPRSPKVSRRVELGQLDETNIAPPKLDTHVTGFVTKDPSARELDRCKLTVWSYAGCWVVYPTQGRIWTKFECEHVIDDDARMRSCRNYAEHLAVGDGGPPDRKRGFEILEAVCDAGEKTACMSIAELLMWDDFERAKTYATKACVGDPASNPTWCQDALVAPRRFAVALTDVEHVDGITKETACTFGVIDHGGSCRVRFACGDRVLYGAFGGTTPCHATPAGSTKLGLVGAEAMPSSEDDDPAIEFDAETVHVHDLASATNPMFHIRGTLKAL